jgi:hypothetical protein
VHFDSCATLSSTWEGPYEIDKTALETARHSPGNSHLNRYYWFDTQKVSVAKGCW